MSMKKKAEMSGQKMVFYMVLIFLFAVCFLGLAYFMIFYATAEAQIPEGLEESMLIQRFTASCFGEKQGMIDFQEFSSASLAACYDLQEGEEGIAFNLKLKSLAAKESFGEKTIHTLNWEAGKILKTYTKEVVIYQGQERHMGVLVIEMQQ